MHFVSKRNWTQVTWLREQVALLNMTDQCTSTTGLAFQYEKQIAREIHIARKIADWIHSYEKCTLWITDYGIWPSHENWTLYEKLRSAYGDQTKLADAPLHVFDSEEKNDFVTFLELAFRFGWGGKIIYKSKNNEPPLSMRFDHHGWFFVNGKEQKLRRIENDLEMLNISVMWRKDQPMH